MEATWTRLVVQVPQSATLIASVADRVAGIDHRLWDWMAQSEHSYRRDNYLIRYGLPLAELYGWPDRNDPLLVEALSVHFFWALTWRHLDNIVDSHAVDPLEVGRLALALYRASRVHSEVALRFGIPSRSDEVAELILLLCTTAHSERIAPVRRTDIWRRAAPFLIVPRTLLGIGDEREQIYQAYINLDGLSHDIHDLLDDVSRGIKSLPSSWFAELDPQSAFRRGIVDAWFLKAAHEVAAALDQVERLMAGAPFRALRLLLQESEDLKQSLGPSSRPP